MSDMQHYFVTVEHVSLGWLVFSVITFVFFFSAPKIFERNKLTTIHQSAEPSNDNISTIKAFSPIAMLVAAQLVLAYFEPSPLDQYPELPVYTSAPGWSKADYESDWQPQIKGAAVEAHSELVYKEKSHTPIYLHIYFYHAQKQEAEAVGYANKITDSSWEIVNTKTINVNTALGKMNIEESLITRNENKRLVWSWFWINGTNTSYPLLAKLWNGLNLITGNPEITRIIVATDIHSENTRGANTLLTSFIEQEFPLATQSFYDYQKIIK